MKSRRFIFWFCMLVVMAFLLAACTSESIKQQQLSSDEEPPEVIEEEAQEDIDKGQTITLVTPDTVMKAPEEKSKYQIHTRLTDFHLLSESTGVAWGITDAALRLYRTQDYGETWVDISPSSNVPFGGKLVYGKDIVFTDKDHGWIIRNKQGSAETVLLNTSNGGESWKISSIPGTGEVTALSFVSPQQGWILSTDDLTRGSEQKSLYRTTNSGGLWNQIMQNSEYSSASVPGSVIPRTGSVIGLTFTDATVGFATIREIQSSKLYITRDGGEKWKSSGQVFKNKQLDACGNVTTGAPKLLGGRGNSIEVYIPVTCAKNDQSGYFGYFTGDAGKSWNLVSFPNQGIAREGSLQPVFRRVYDGHRMVNGIIQHSSDMGRTWKAYPRSKLLADNLANYPNVVKLQFVSSDVGWMLIETDDKKRSRLMKSSDGGVTWQGI
ncbi:hypothetical protein JCM10914A_42070 [Paenibacillus sp. JCM 10914]|nr:hypothetical protein JCM10914_1523 [Paenibacillus sp. JCM 10914]